MGSASVVSRIMVGVVAVVVALAVANWVLSAVFATLRWLVIIGGAVAIGVAIGRSRGDD